MIESYESAALRAMFASLVQHAGKGPAVVAAIRETTGRQMSEGTLSKIISGEGRFDWNLAFQLEEIAGRFPIRTMLMARVPSDPVKAQFDELAVRTMKEVGDIGPALLDAVRTGDFTKLDKEGPEAVTAITAAMAFGRSAREGDV
ncbi:hypothetical protein RPE78_09530 [Thioclava litoralis]|uniref:Uncharacterized protein n=1 Tax=Thioclava litoralis TaxID=3076557 RepID=A0ABZ1DY63_9RHOB|nr:hypothetical protein RPE78_09530 [Thioclava sp. FTW29]